MREQRNHRSPRVISIRSIVPADLEDLRKPSARAHIAKIRDSHHKVARLIASGMKQVEVAKELGYSEGRLSILCNSPAIKDLIAKYRGEEDEAWREKRDEYYEHIYSAGARAWRQLNEILEEGDDDESARLPAQRLLAIADSSADRIGYNKKSTTVNVNIDFAARLEKAIARSAPKLIERQLDD